MFNYFRKVNFKENWHFYALAFFIALLPFQFALNPAAGFDLAIARVIIIILFYLLLFSKFKFKDFFVGNRITKLIYIFLFLATLTLAISQNIFWSLRKLAFLFSIFPIYFISLSVFKNKTNQRNIFIALTSGATLIAAVALVQFSSQFVFGIDNVYNFIAKYSAPFFLGNSFSNAVLSYPSWLVASQGNTYMRAFGTFPDPHMLSYYLGLSLSWAVSLAATSNKHAKLFWVSAALILAADIATFTRGGYIALIASAIVVLPLVSKNAIKKIAAAIALVIILFLAVPRNPVAGRLVSSFDTNEGSNQARLSNWDQAALIIKQHPFGVGIGMYSLAVDPTSDYRTPIYAHNLYLDIAAELGILTAIIFISILTTTFFSFWKKAKLDPFFIAGVASITLFSVHSLVESPIYSVHVLPVFLITIALAATVRIGKNEIIKS